MKHIIFFILLLALTTACINEAPIDQTSQEADLPGNVAPLEENHGTDIFGDAELESLPPMPD